MKVVFNDIELEPISISIDIENGPKYQWYRCDRCQNRTHIEKIFPIRDETLCVRCYNIIKYCLLEEK